MGKAAVEQIGERTFLIPGHVNVGMVREGTALILIDSGPDRKAAELVLRIAKEMKGDVRAIINTHAHAEHYGANHYILRQTGAEIFAPPLEEALIRNPDVEPLYLYGAFPPLALQDPHILARPSRVDHVLRGPVIIDGVTLTPVPLPGHTPNQMGVVVDDIFFVADALFSREAVLEHRLIYYYDPLRHRETLAFLSRQEARLFVPAHGRPTHDIRGLIDANRKNLEETAEAILAAISVPRSAEQVLELLAGQFDLDMSFEAYCLYLCAVKAHLSAMNREGRAAWELDKGCLLWKRT
ncbi:MAG: MBL fold metallo-hydrolase [Candidatus Methylomirabilales bacterium]